MDEDEEIEQQILNSFEENFQRLRMESGHTLSADVKEVAKQQVLLYWKKLKELAYSVTDTEVSLNLPNLETNKGRKYNIEGVVDVVREGKRVTMYDIKTHEADFVNSHKEIYQPQLNVYAYIWEHLKNEKVSEIAVIATRLTKGISRALNSEDPDLIERELKNWNPIIKMTLNPETVNNTISEFSNVVDQIEGHIFLPPKDDELSKKQHTGNTFATDVCGNCDARFSCSSYRIYAARKKTRSWTKFADLYENYTLDEDLNVLVEVSMESENHLDDLLEDLS